MEFISKVQSHMNNSEMRLLGKLLASLRLSCIFMMYSHHFGHRNIMHTISQINKSELFDSLLDQSSTDTEISLISMVISEFKTSMTSSEYYLLRQILSIDQPTETRVSRLSQMDFIMDRGIGNYVMYL